LLLNYSNKFFSSAYSLVFQTKLGNNSLFEVISYSPSRLGWGYLHQR